MFLFDLGRFAAEVLLVVFAAGLAVGVVSVPPFFGFLWLCQRACAALQSAGFGPAALMLLAFRNLLRNALRTALSFFAVFILVLVVVMIWTMLSFLDSFTEQKQSGGMKVIISDRYEFLGGVPARYPREILDIANDLPPGERPPRGESDLMVWSFVITVLDPNARSFDNNLALVATRPEQITNMFDGLDEFSPEQLEELQRVAGAAADDVQAAVIGSQLLTLLNKKVGERVRVTCSNFSGLTFDFKIVGTFPPGRYDQSAVMNIAYLDRALDAYERENGRPHPRADETVNFIWLRLPSEEAFRSLAAAVEGSSRFERPLRVETASAGLANLFEPYRDLLWGLRWLLAPAILATMTLIIANAISISVRERRAEMAVMKVLGFRPRQVMFVVLSEAVLIGGLTGLYCAGGLYFSAAARGGFPTGFLPPLFVPAAALWWGPAVGVGTALAGSLLPAWSARSVRASDVFAKVT